MIFRAFLKNVFLSWFRFCWLCCSNFWMLILLDVFIQILVVWIKNVRRFELSWSKTVFSRSMVVLSPHTNKHKYQLKHKQNMIAMFHRHLVARLSILKSTDSSRYYSRKAFNWILALASIACDLGRNVKWSYNRTCNLWDSLFSLPKTEGSLAKYNSPFCQHTCLFLSEKNDLHPTSNDPTAAPFWPTQPSGFSVFFRLSASLSECLLGRKTQTFCLFLWWKKNIFISASDFFLKIPVRFVCKSRCFFIFVRSQNWFAQVFWEKGPKNFKSLKFCLFQARKNVKHSKQLTTFLKVNSHMTAQALDLPINGLIQMRGHCQLLKSSMTCEQKVGGIIQLVQLVICF